VSSRVIASQVDIDSVVTCFRNSVRRTSTEEEVKVWVPRCVEEGILKPFLGRWLFIVFCPTVCLSMAPKPLTAEPHCQLPSGPYGSREPGSPADT